MRAAADRSMSTDADAHNDSQPRNPAESGKQTGDKRSVCDCNEWHQKKKA
jgi:hypothetical protein